MTRLEIRVFGDPVLRQRAHEVDDFDGRLATLAADMLDTMRAADGVGLAANQVGILKRLFTWEVPGEDHDDEPLGGAVVNPVLLDSSEQLQEGDEGCLSFPGLLFPLDRALRVEVAHQDLRGDRRTVQLEGHLARIFLHEMDHLDGVLFIDHLAAHDRDTALRIMRERELQGTDPAAPVPGGLLLGRAAPAGSAPRAETDRGAGGLDRAASGGLDRAASGVLDRAASGVLDRAASGDVGAG